MKKILTSIIILLFSINVSFSQNEEISDQIIQSDTIECEYEIPKSDFPQYVTKNKTTIGVILSIEQLQKIDSDLELLKLFNSKCRWRAQYKGRRNVWRPRRQSLTVSAPAVRAPCLPARCSACACRRVPCVPQRHHVRRTEANVRVCRKSDVHAAEDRADEAAPPRIPRSRCHGDS